ncbi:MAG TPA: hypothetical protein VD993_19440 [Chitinophagaceae bacterium]|nr:hypothetical protein [Chitinophagaceae bacterium]
MEATKILLSQEELNLVQDTHWLLTKNNIIEKAKSLFGDLAASLRQQTNELAAALPQSVQLFSPKVFKGEYYQGLPYVMLDYPRVFAKDDVLAIRTFFWWGNFFSVTLQLKGSYHQLYLPALMKHRTLLAQQQFHVSVSDDEWRHDFEPDNYQPVSGDNQVFENAIAGKFVKLAVRVPLAQWNNAFPLLEKHHATLIGMLAG